MIRKAWMRARFPAPSAPWKLKTFLGMLVVTAATYAALIYVAVGRDLDGRYAQTDPATRDWFRGLHSRKGFGCCDHADGMRVDDPDWDCKSENGEDICAVKLDGKWVAVETDQMVDGTNRVGYAIVWPYKDETGWHVRCFMKGTLS